jgi:polyphosphate kinase 2 (PPK2 family)
VLVTRVHGLLPAGALPERYRQINDFERLLASNGTCVIKFFLHISPAEQLARFKERLDDPDRNWKISEADYTERALWPQYAAAYEEALEATSTADAPWYVIPADHKWFRDLAVGRILADALGAMDLKHPAPRVDLADIRRRYHSAAAGASAATASSTDMNR